MGVPPEDYAKRLIEDALALQREAEGGTFSQIMKPVRRATGAVDDSEIVALVETARNDHHRNAGRRKRR